VADLLQALGRSYQSLGLYLEAARLFQDSLEIRRRQLGPEHDDTLDSLLELAAIQKQRGAHAEAEPLLLLLEAYQAYARRPVSWQLDDRRQEQVLPEAARRSSPTPLPTSRSPRRPPPAEPICGILQVFRAALGDSRPVGR
jgi:tetratricopeptide (TPR) repeat protein